MSQMATRTAYDHVSDKIADAVAELRKTHNDQYAAGVLADHLADIATLMRDIEWSDSRGHMWKEEFDQRILAIMQAASKRWKVVAVAMGIEYHLVDGDAAEQERRREDTNRTWKMAQISAYEAVREMMSARIARVHAEPPRTL